MNPRIKFTFVFFIFSFSFLHSNILYAFESEEPSAKKEVKDENSSSLQIEPNESKSDVNAIILPKSLKFGAFVDTYYSHNANHPKSKERAYTTQAVRNDEFNINLGFVDAKWQEEKIRGRIALQFGTSVNTNYAAESRKDISSNQNAVKHIQEAYVGFKLTKNTWLDAGIYFGHIGHESWISSDNWNYTRALALDYVPYYSSGVRITTKFTEKFQFQFHVMNGWQNITDQNKDKSLGTQFKYQFTPHFAITANQFVGNEAPDFERKQTRFYNNTILEWKVFDWLAFALSGDVGAQKTKESLSYEPWWKDVNSVLPTYISRESKAYNQWYHGTFWTSFRYEDLFRLSFRIERFYDPKQVLAETYTRNGFLTNGYTMTFDLLQWQPGLLRIEAIQRESMNAVFETDQNKRSRVERLFVVAASIRI
ncbi:porin [Leptospira kemamanensis]|uniref:Porin n=1 Tax=Leptospira kemamanensis TaxID=2484942 RepID=A0A4R9JW41_9LEPT|nr:porin [Leptospira kemamanensis]TGL56586.1 porin [Leptospira kemamanensis]